MNLSKLMGKHVDRASCNKALYKSDVIPAGIIDSPDPHCHQREKACCTKERVVMRSGKIISQGPSALVR